MDTHNPIDDMEIMPTPPSPIDLDDFREWLEAGRPLAACGNPGDERNCPLANYLSGKYGRTIRVSATGMIDPLLSDAEIALPRWARAFIVLVDTNRGAISYGHAFRCLRLVLEQWPASIDEGH